MVTADPLIGREFGKCRIESRIGAGGMGVVYLAEHTVIHDRRAVKVLSSALAGQEEYRHRFLNEARLPASLNHPSILKIHDAGDVDGVLYLVMPYVRGADLQGLIDANGPLDIDEAVTILTAVADALDEAHSAGLVHRDVKPSNVLVGELESGGRRQVYLSDFGLVKALDRAARASGTTQGMVVGTPPYIAPELWREEPFDGRIDQYALACTIFFALTGTLPFEAPTMFAWMHAHTSSPIPSVSSRRPELPRDVDEPLVTGMAKDPADRFETCTALVQAVAGSVGSLPPAPTDTLDTRLREQTRLGIETVAERRSAGTTKKREMEEDEGRKPSRRVAALVAGAVLLVAVAALIVLLLQPDDVVADRKDPVLQPDAELNATMVVAGRDDEDGSILLALERAAGVNAEIVRIDPTTLEPSPVADIEGVPTQILADGRTTWVLTRNELFRIADDGAPPTSVDFNAQTGKMTLTSDAMWVTLPLQDQVLMVDPATSEFVRIPVEGAPHFVTLTSGIVLIAGDEGLATTLELKTGDPIGSVEFGGVPIGLTNVRGSGWLVTSDGHVVEIAVDDGAPVATPLADVGGHPLRISPGFQGLAVWISDRSKPRLVRVDTLVPGDSQTADLPDPALKISTASGRTVIAATAEGQVIRIGADSAEVEGKPERIDDEPGATVQLGQNAVVLIAVDGSIYRLEL